MNFCKSKSLQFHVNDRGVSLLKYIEIDGNALDCLRNSVSRRCWRRSESHNCADVRRSGAAPGETRRAREGRRWAEFRPSPLFPAHFHRQADMRLSLPLSDPHRGPLRGQLREE